MDDVYQGRRLRALKRRVLVESNIAIQQLYDIVPSATSGCVNTLSCIEVDNYPRIEEVYNQVLQNRRVILRMIRIAQRRARRRGDLKSRRLLFRLSYKLAIASEGAKEELRQLPYSSLICFPT